MILETFEFMEIDLYPIEELLKSEMAEGTLRGRKQTLSVIYERLDVFLEEILKAFTDPDSYFHADDLTLRTIQQYVEDCQKDAGLLEERVSAIRDLRDHIRTQKGV